MRTNWLIGGLEVVKQTLKRQRDALCWTVVFCGDLVNRLDHCSQAVNIRRIMTRYLSEVVGVEERLQYGVHMVCNTLVFQSDISAFLLRIVAGRTV